MLMQIKLRPAFGVTASVKLTAFMAIAVPIFVLAGQVQAVDLNAELANSYGYASEIAQAVKLPDAATLARSPKKVFAHYVPNFPLSIDNAVPSNDYYETQYLNPNGENNRHLSVGGFIRDRPLPRPPLSDVPVDHHVKDDVTEITRAVGEGIDGFSFDVQGMQGDAYSANTAGYILDNIMAATDSVDNANFHIMLVPDMDVLQGVASNNLSKGTNDRTSIEQELKEIVEKYNADPASYHLPDGRLVLSPYDAQDKTAQWWQQQMAVWKGDGVNVALVPIFQNYVPASSFAPISYGMSEFQDLHAGDGSTIHSFNPSAIWMGSITAQEFRPRDSDYFEENGSARLQYDWSSAIKALPDWVQLVTWNDYSEGTEFSPSMDEGYALSDLNAYYTAWFKTGSPPPIRQDALYYYHRVESTSAPYNTTAQSSPFHISSDSYTSTPNNEVELLSLLTAPATLSITLNGQTVSQDVPAGLQTLRVPLVDGTASFSLQRDGISIGSFQSSFPISNEGIAYQDLQYRAGGYLVPLSLSVSLAGGTFNVPVSISISNHADGVSVASFMNLATAGGNTVSVTDPGLLTAIDNLGTVDVRVKPAGYLSQTLSSITYPLSVRVQAGASQPFVVGDFDGDDRIGLGDIVSLIRAFNANYTGDAATAKADFGAVSISDIVTVIRNYNVAPVGRN